MSFVWLKIEDKTILKKLAKNLKKIRKAKGVTQEELAYSSGISLSQIARIETCRINPTVITLSVISKTLNIHIKELFDFK